MVRCGDQSIVEESFQIGLLCEVKIKSRKERTLLIVALGSMTDIYVFYSKLNFFPPYLFNPLLIRE